MPFTFENLALPGLVLVRSRIIGDERGFFVENYKKSDFYNAGITESFVQDNHSKSTKGVLRGLHYQKDPHAQGKLVRCIAGRVLDVGVDIRKGSATFGKWAAAELSAENAHMLYLPPGFAHGFLVLSDTAEVMYKCTTEYSAAHDSGIIWNDPEIGVNWGITAPLLSPKDQKFPMLKDAQF